MGTVARNRLLYRALLASLALHFVLFAFIPPLASVEGAQNVELLSFVRIQTVRIQTPKPKVEPPAKAAVAGPVPIISKAHAPTIAMRPVQHAPASAAPQRQVAPVLGSAQPGSIAEVTHPPLVATPSATPGTPDQSDATSRQAVGGYMPLGADEPAPILDPAVRKELLALGVHVTLTIVVDSTGRTKSVAFEPPLDDNVEKQIRSLLASAQWDA
ncbi:MAG: hypothetical protein WBD74_09955, partial [Candidatus Aquilonibacter sp.]